MGRLRTKMEQDLVIRGLGRQTSHSYWRAVEGLTRHYGRAPDTLSPDEVKAYLAYLRAERQVTAGHVKAVVTGLRFFYEVTLGHRREDFFLPSPKLPKSQPHVLSRQQVERLLTATTHRRDRLLFMTAYSAGLRVSEVVRLKVSHIDSERMLLRIERGKGQKDRYALLTERLLAELRAYWRAFQPPVWLFYGQPPEQPLCVRTVQRRYKEAKRRAGITKPGSVHGLRHAFATHLIEAGVDLSTVQRLLGHSHVETTTRYLHLAPRTLAQRGSLCDLLDFAPPR